MAQVVNILKSKKKRVSKEMITKVINDIVGEEALEVIFYLRGKSNISEFIVAEELDIEIHQTRRLLYKLLEHNVVSFTRKKDKIKGWYICYWDFNEKMVPYLVEKIKNKKIEKLKNRLESEEDNTFYMCRSACIRMNFEKSMEFDFKCLECGDLMHEQDNSRTIEFLRGKVSELEVSKVF